MRPQLAFITASILLLGSSGQSLTQSIDFGPGGVEIIFVPPIALSGRQIWGRGASDNVHKKHDLGTKKLLRASGPPSGRLIVSQALNTNLLRYHHSGC
jgi:hypothetical protein